MGAFESWRILYQTQGTFKIHEQGIVQFHLVYMADVVTDTGTVCIHEHTYTRARIPKLATRVNKVTLAAKSLSGSIEHALTRAKKWEQKDLHDRAVRKRVQQGKCLDFDETNAEAYTNHPPISCAHAQPP